MPTPCTLFGPKLHNCNYASLHILIFIFAEIIFSQICYEFQLCLVPLEAATFRVPQVGPKCTTQTSTTLHPNMGTWAWPECTPHLQRCTPRVAPRGIMGIRQEPLIIGLMERRCQSRGLQGVPVEKICLWILQVQLNEYETDPYFLQLSQLISVPP